MGKAEGHGTNWHGHVTALSVAPDYRRLGLAAKLMSGLEEISEKYELTLFFHSNWFTNSHLLILENRPIL